MSEQVRITEGGKPLRLTKQRAIVKRRANAALNGNDRAADKVLSMAEKFEDRDPGSDGRDIAEEDRRIVASYRERLRAELLAEPPVKDGAV